MINNPTYKAKRQLSIIVWIGVVLFTYWTTETNAQTLPVGFPALEEYVRRMQQTGESDSSVSLTVRPLFPLYALAWKKSFSPEDENKRKYTYYNFGKGTVAFMPVVINSQYNSHHPIGRNDGSLIPNKGIQVKYNAGIFASYGKFSVQYMPEYLKAQNLYFEEFDKRHFEVIWGRKYRWWNRIETPVRFGDTEFTSFYRGQTSVRFTLKEFSAGISNESLWWGPGKRNALLMSNNAAPFLHMTLNTVKPVHTRIGSFEGQLIGGKLNNTIFTPPDTATKIFFLSNLYHPKRDSWRYLSGMVITWQPKWTPGLFVGYSRVSQVYHDEITRFVDLVPFFNGRNDFNLDADLLRTTNQQMSSAFFRWVLPESKAELYAEFGTNGNSRSLREFLLRPNLNRAFTVGVSKIYSIGTKGGIEIELETTQMGQVVRSTIRNAESWYLHPHIRQGYTNMGQVIGAGIGPGSNVQYLGVNWFRGVNRIGIFGERMVHNNDFFYFAYEDSNDWRRFWTDLSTGILADWRFADFMLSSKLMYTRSWNYQWFLKQNPGDPYFISGKNVTNLHATINLAYIIN
jgi:hypothetical protein